MPSKWLVALALLLMGVTGGASEASHETLTLDLLSGQAPLGARDPIVDFSRDGVTYQDTIVWQHPFNNRVPGTQWVSVNSSGSPFGSMVRFRVTFDLPAGFVSPSLTTALHTDNWADIYLNGTRIGGQPPFEIIANFVNPPESFSTSSATLFLAGTNVLEYFVSNGGDPGGIDFSARISYQPNHAPVAGDDVAQTPQYQSVVIDVLANDSDPDGDALAVESVTQPANGSVSLNAEGTLTYTPDHHFKGQDGFTYTVTDGLASATGAVTVSEVGCGEDSLDSLEGTPGDGLGSEFVDRTIEPLVGDIDPSLAKQLHEVNCALVVPAEDAVDGLVP